ncbi:hypothetical protein EYF80_044058 [Liparis tanakae]|uniref:Uncharacterized protein n=1 Tax=Liparis tanakae TaxID=230148 RepID=A0A4Z2FWS8_9TELE|nr:hypothetical protein EYF80_044058 [Liparis tanakae]
MALHPSPPYRSVDGHVVVVQRHPSGAGVAVDGAVQCSVAGSVLEPASANRIPNQRPISSEEAAWRNTRRLTHLQHGHLLAVAQQAEGEGVLVVQARADLAAPQGQGGDVALQVIAVLVEQQLVVLQAAPALPPAVIGQHVEVAWRPRAQRGVTTNTLRHS